MPITPSPRKRITEAREAVRDAVALVHPGDASSLLREGSGLYRLLVESVTDYAIFALAPDGTILSWNAGARRIKGYEAAEIVGRHIRQFYPKEDQDAGKPGAILDRAAKDGRVEDLGWRVRKDGSRFWASVVVTALHDEAGRLAGFAKVTRDLTERLAAQERAINDARRIASAEASSRAKTDFLAAMSHELRTPLNAIGGYVELIQLGVGGGAVSPKQAEYLERVRTAQQHLLTLINDLLNYSRIEAGQLVYDMSPIQLHSVVQNVLTLVEPQASRKRITLAHDGCGEDLIALADRVKVEQILLNLLSNAVKFTPEGGTVVCQCIAQRDAAVVVVEDSGPGVPDSQSDVIFEPFVQLGRSLTSSQEGTGLGLAISRDMARAMDGEIFVSPASLGGAAFTLRLKTA